jgi:hypothetical protein
MVVCNDKRTKDVDKGSTQASKQQPQKAEDVQALTRYFVVGCNSTFSRE